MNFNKLCNIVLEAKAASGFTVNDKVDFDEVVATIKSQKTLDIFSLIRHEPNITLGQMAVKMGKTPQHLRPNLIKLLDAGFVSKGDPIKKVPVSPEKIPIAVREQLRDVAEDVEATVETPTEEDYVIGVKKFASDYSNSPIAKRYVLNVDEDGNANVNVVKIKNDIKQMLKSGLLKKKKFSDEDEVPELELDDDDFAPGPIDSNVSAAYKDYQASGGAEDY